MDLFKDKTLLLSGSIDVFGDIVPKSFIETNIKEIRIFSRDAKNQNDMRHKYQLSNQEKYLRILIVFT